MADEETQQQQQENEYGEPLDPNVRKGLQSDLTAPNENPAYSDISTDGVYYNKYVVLPFSILRQKYTVPALSKLFDKHLDLPDRLLTREEWMSLGVTEMEGWEHYMIHPPEPHVLCFRKPKPIEDPPNE